MNAVKAAKGLNLWNGKFNDYAQSLHNKGFIFKGEVYRFLVKKGVELTYPENCWIVRFYKRWVKEGGWTFVEATRLFRGNNPKTGNIELHDLSQNPYILYPIANELFSWDDFDEEIISIDDRLSRHVSVLSVNSFEWKDKKGQENLLYKPKIIVKWLLEHTLYIPPRPLLIALGKQEVKDFEQNEDRRIKDNKEASELQIKSKRQNELHNIIGNIWNSLNNIGNGKPSASEVFKKLQKTKDDHPCIQEITDNHGEMIIYWVSYLGNEQQMAYGAFCNVVSDYNTGKKSVNNHG